MRGRYSLLGIDPDLVFRASGAAAEINREWRTDRDAFDPCAGDALAELRALADACRIDRCPKACRPRSPVWSAISATRPSAWSKRCRARRQPAGTARHAVRAAHGRSGVRRADQRTVRHRADLGGERSARRRRACWRADRRGAAASLPGLRPLRITPRCPILPDLAPVIAADDYKAMALRAKDYILAGDIFQVVLAQRFTCPFPLPPLSLYRALRRVNPSPFLYFLDLPGFALVGSSPEILVRVRPDGEKSPSAPSPALARVGRARRGHRQRSQPARRSQGTCRAPDAARSGAQ